MIQRKSQKPAIAIKLEGRVRHCRIEHQESKFRFRKQPETKERGLRALVERTMETSRSGKHMFMIDQGMSRGPTRVRLLNPIRKRENEEGEETEGTETKGKDFKGDMRIGCTEIKEDYRQGKTKQKSKSDKWVEESEEGSGSGYKQSTITGDQRGTQRKKQDGGGNHTGTCPLEGAQRCSNTSQQRRGWQQQRYIKGKRAQPLKTELKSL